MCKRCVAVAMVVLVLFQDAAFARQNRPPLPKSGRLTWSELGPLIVERRAKMTLTNGVRVQGEILAVRPEGLVMDVAKSSDKATFPKGQNEIPRELVTEMRLLRTSGPGRLVGGILGTVGGLFTAGMSTYLGGATGAVLGFFVAVPLAAVGGYYAGKLADRRSNRILIQPEVKASAPPATEEVLP